MRKWISWLSGQLNQLSDLVKSVIQSGNQQSVVIYKGWQISQKGESSNKRLTSQQQQDIVNIPINI